MTHPLRQRALTLVLRGALPALAALVAAPAQAFGLNNIYGSQAIGRPLYAEIPLQSAPSVSEQCVALRPAEGLADFFPADLKLTVAGPASARRLVITSHGPIRSPMISFLVDVRCPEAAMAREYTLLADNAPPTLPATAAPRDKVAGDQSGGAAGVGTGTTANGETLLLAQATTLNAMARSLYPDDRAARDAYRAAFATANPELFAGKDSIGAIPLAAGTRLKAPAGVPLPGAAGAKTSKAAKAAATKTSETTADRAAAAPTKARVAADGDARKGDRLSVGSGNSQLQMLADAIMRLEASAAERDKINAELVGGVSGALNSIIELKDRVGIQDKQVQQLLALQMASERQRARDREQQIGPWTLLALLLAAMLAGAGLITLHHLLAARRRDAGAGDFAFAGHDNEDEPPRDDPWRQVSSSVEMPAAGEPDAVAAPAPAMPPVPPSPAAVAPTAPPAATMTAPAAVTRAPPPASASADSGHELEFDDLLQLFSEQKAAVGEMIRRLQATGSRDPDEWLALVRQARAAGLMNSDEMQNIIVQFKQVFNAALQHEGGGPGLEGFPPVLKRIRGDWGTSAGLALLNSLLYDDRDGGRTGFPETAFEDLVLLRDVLAVRLALYGEEVVAAAPAVEPAPAPARGEHRNAAPDAIEFELELPPPADKAG